MNGVARSSVGNLSSRRGRIESQEERERTHIVAAHVPLSEMFGYATDLRSRTCGRGTFTMQFALYQPLDPSENEDDDSMVGAPRKPKPTFPDSSVALPEPTANA